MFQHILLATDGSAVMQHATRYAAKLFPNSQFHVLTIINTSDTSVPMTEVIKDSLKKAADKFIKTEVDILKAEGANVKKTEVITGIPSKEVVRYIQENHIELLVMGRTGKECPIHLGNTCINLLEISHCPMLIVPHDSSVDLPKTILNPTTGSHYSMSASELAVVVADNFGSELHSLYLGRNDPRVILRTVEARAQKLDVRFQGKSSKGPADKEIIEAASKHDMMIFSRGHAGFTYKMRKVSKKAALGKLEREMIGGSPIPMLVVGD